MQIEEILQIIEVQMADTHCDLDRVTALGDETLQAHYGGAMVALENLAARLENEYQYIGRPG